MEIFDDKALIKRICDICYEMQNTKSPQLAALKKQLKQNKKEIDNVMNAVKAGLITKSTKAALEALEQEQEELEAAISLEKISRPVISREYIETWIMKFADTDLSNQEQKQTLIDIFVNCVYVYEDKMVVFLNHKDGEKYVRFEDLHGDTKKSNTLDECSTSFSIGDPYGN